MDAAMSSRLHPASISTPARFAISDSGSGEPSGIVQSLLGVVIVVPLLVSVVSEVSGFGIKASLEFGRFSQHGRCAPAATR
jgi:hypothetical protein